VLAIAKFRVETAVKRFDWRRCRSARVYVDNWLSATARHGTAASAFHAAATAAQMDKNIAARLTAENGMSVELLGGGGTRPQQRRQHTVVLD